MEPDVNMGNLSSQKEWIEKILNSEEFASSHIYRTYLTYLIEAKQQEKSLKESTIAIEFFGKSADFNPSEDAIVRSHTYNLRKKLETYYLKEGKEDKFRIKIPKGHYEVTFIPASGNDRALKRRLYLLIQHKYWILIIVLLLIALAMMTVQNRTITNKLHQYQIIDRSDAIWKDYLQSKLPVLIAVGDHFFFNEYSEIYENLLAMRDGKINSQEDLETFMSQHPEKRIQPADEPYFPYHSIWSLPPILSILYSANQKPILRKSSAVSPQILGEYNIIFLGSIKTLYSLKYTLSKSHFNFGISPHFIKYSPPGTDSVRTFNTSLHSTGLNEDLVLALKLPGPADNSIFIIASYHSLGAPEIANYLTDPVTCIDLEQKFLEKYQQVPHYFELLFRVTGIDKTAYDTELLIYNQIRKEEQ
jgi:hypothetical protein